MTQFDWRAVVAAQIESLIEPDGRGDPAYQAGRNAGLTLAAALVRHHPAIVRVEHTITPEGAAALAGAGLDPESVAGAIENSP